MGKRWKWTGYQMKCGGIVRKGQKSEYGGYVIGFGEG